MRTIKKAVNKKKVGRPSLEPKISIAHRKIVEEAIAAGKTHGEVLLDLQECGLPMTGNDSFIKYFKAEIERGLLRLEGGLVQNLYEKARSKDPKNNNCLFFALKTRFGWRETSLFEFKPDTESKEQLKSLIEQCASGKLSLVEAVKAAALIETTEKASKGNLGEILPSVVVSPYSAADIENELNKSTEQKGQEEQKEQGDEGSD